MMSLPPFTRRTRQVATTMLLILVTFIGSMPAAGATPDSSGRAGWVWPVGAPHPIVRPFIAPETPYASGHRGIDIAAPSGTSVRTPADGIVHYSGFLVDRYVVSIDLGSEIVVSFEPVISDLPEGTPVRRGQVIGTLQPGHCVAPCLHFGVRSRGRYLSPLAFLSSIPHAVLLPTRSLE